MKRPSKIKKILGLKLSSILDPRSQIDLTTSNMADYDVINIWLTVILATQLAVRKEETFFVTQKSLSILAINYIVSEDFLFMFELQNGVILWFTEGIIL